MSFDGTVLLVDDEAHIRKYIGLILKQLGQPVIFEAGNGLEGIEVFKRESPDLVLLDVNMPVMEGIEALQKLKEIDPDCIVVMLTSLANRQTITEAQALGAANYIRKDTPKEEIAAALSEVIADNFELDDEPNEPTA